MILDHICQYQFGGNNISDITREIFYFLHGQRIKGIAFVRNMLESLPMPMILSGEGLKRT